jgi:hypothetical protein
MEPLEDGAKRQRSHSEVQRIGQNVEMPYYCYKCPMPSTRTIKKVDMMSWVALLGVIAFVAAIFPTAAYAYIDPGTGSLLAQMAIASVLTLGATIKFQSQRVKGFVKTLLRRFRR